MSVAKFDPRVLTLYQTPRYLLHFEWSRSPLIYRYALVEVIKPANIQPTSNQKLDEIDLTQREIWDKKYRLQNGST